MDLSVIIPTTRTDYLDDVLGSILNQEAEISYEVILVDNSIDKRRSEEIFKFFKDWSRDFSNLKYLRVDEDGLHNARNKGVLYSNSDIVLFIDDDIIADKNLIKNHFSVYEKYDVCGGKVVPLMSDVPHYIKLIRNPYLSLKLDNEMREDDLNLCGNNLSVRKDIVLKCGGFNPEMFQSRKVWLGGDGESGLLRKVKQIGGRILYNPNAIVYHIIGKERVKMDYIKERAFLHGIQMSYSKFFGGRFPKNHILFMRSLAFFSIHLYYKVLSILPSKIKYNSSILSSLYLARSIYEMKLIFDKSLKEYVSKTNWIE